MIKINQLPPVDVVRSAFSYDPDTGVLKWKIREGPFVAVGKVAGSVTSCGYVAVGFGGENYQAHRLVWLHFYGVDPGDDEIDHRNLCKADNSIKNLRRSSRSENFRNVGLRRDNKSGVKGVSWSARHSKWQARVSYDGARQHIGFFEDLDAAGAAVRAVREAQHGEFARHA